jgi:TonB-dependent receptor
MAQTAPTTDPATVPAESAEAQTVPADPAVAEPAAEDAAAGQETIVVTGLRRSLQTAQNIKKNSEQIVDVIVAEDIGKLPDRTVSEALARVPGVTVDRRSGEAGDVFVRGLRDPATTYNGREIFTAEARNVAPQDFPAGGVAALEVFKSLTADQIEGNLAGQINVRGRRPFDFADFELAGSLNATYADLADDVAWNGNVLISNRWDVGGGEIGALLNVSYTELTYTDNVRFNSGDTFGINPSAANPNVYCDNFDFGCLGGAPAFNIPGTTVRVPAVIGLFQGSGKRWRPSANAAVQWKPSSELMFYVDGLYQGFRREVSDRRLDVRMFAAPSYTNVVLGPEGDVFDYADSLTATPNPVPTGNQAATFEKTDTYQVAGGAVYNTDRFRFSADLARTTSQFDLSVYGVDFRANGPVTVNVDFDGGGDGGSQFDLSGRDLSDLSNLVYEGFFDRFTRATGDDVQLRLDGTIKDPLPWIRGVDLGVRFADRDAGFSDARRFSNAGNGMSYGTLPLSFDTFDFNFRDDQQPFNQLTLPTYGSIRGSIVELRTLAGSPLGRPIAGGGAGQDFTGPLDDYSVNEKSYSGYAQLRWGFDAGGIPVDGVLGLRAVQTKTKLDGTVETAPGVFAPLSIANDYWDYLPNASIRARLTDKLQVRAAYTQTRRRPDFGQLNPGLRLDPPPAPGIERTGNGGNPFLEPILSNNYDLSLEYYFSRSGFASVALFRRDVSNFIVNGSEIQNIPDVGPVRVFSPVNSDKGVLQGVEAQFRTFFDFDFVPQWARAFGTEINATYIDNKLDAPGNPNGEDIAFPDVSKWSYNLVGFYEKGPLTARLAYNYRSKFVQSFDTAGDQTSVRDFSNGVDRLDASLSYAINDKLTIAGDVSNILGKPFRNFRRNFDGVNFPVDIRYEERVYSLGIRAKM